MTDRKMPIVHARTVEAAVEKRPARYVTRDWSWLPARLEHRAALIQGDIMVGDYANPLQTCAVVIRQLTREIEALGVEPRGVGSSDGDLGAIIARNNDELKLWALEERHSMATITDNTITIAHEAAMDAAVKSAHDLPQEQLGEHYVARVARDSIRQYLHIMESFGYVVAPRYPESGMLAADHADPLTAAQTYKRMLAAAPQIADLYLDELRSPSSPDDASDEKSPRPAPRRRAAKRPAPKSRQAAGAKRKPGDRE